VVAGLLLALLTGWHLLDPIIALIVATNIVWTGFKLVRQSVAGLMDASDPVLDAVVREVLDAETTARSLRYHEWARTEEREYHMGGISPSLSSGNHTRSSTPPCDRDRAGSEQGIAGPVKILSHLETIEEHDLAHGEGLRH